MKEYCIYNVWNGGTPFVIDIFNNLTLAKIKLQEMVDLEEERNRPYYVDNDFFVNKYPPILKGKYFCIKEREVSDWKKLEENNQTLNYDNCVYFKDLLDKRKRR